MFLFKRIQEVGKEKSFAAIIEKDGVMGHILLPIFRTKWLQENCWYTGKDW